MTTIATGGQTGKAKAEDEGSWANKLSDSIKTGTEAFNDATGVDNPRE